MPSSSAKVVLVTGAAGGLGQGLVSEFAAQGWRVAAAHHHSPSQSATESIFLLQLDVIHRAQAEDAVSQILTRWGRLDVLVNNAGITHDQPLWQIHEADWDNLIAVNLKGAFNCAQAALRPMLKQREGHIINLTSFSGRAGQRGQATYAAAKSGLFGLTASLAKEVGSRNVRVNAVLPGVLPTAMTARLKEKQLAELAAANALHRVNSIAEVARFVVFLATLQNVSGQLFQLDSRVARWT